MIIALGCPKARLTVYYLERLSTILFYTKHSIKEVKEFKFILLQMIIHENLFKLNFNLKNT